MRNRLSSAPVKNHLSNPSVEPENLQLFASAVVNGGMVTQIDQVDIQDNQVTLAANATVRYDVTSRRAGSTPLIPGPPDAKPVLALVAFKMFTGGILFIRFTRDSIYFHGVAWAPATGAALLGTDDSDIQFLSVNDRAFFSNQIDALQELNVTTATYAIAGNAPKFKYYCTFAGRIVGANLGGSSPNPILIGWCGDNNFTEWNNLVDISAGSTPLIDSPQDFSDFITGLLGFANNLLVMRERSVWLAVRQASATVPYYFYNAVPGIGCDTPKSIVQIPNGAAWFDRRLGNVYSYQIGVDPMPVPIGAPVRKSIIAEIADPDDVFSGYDAINNEYILGINNKIWKYNFSTKAWCYDVIANTVSVCSLDYQSNTGSIADLVGVIADLVGMIADLSPGSEIPTLFYGKSDGNIIAIDDDVTTDSGVAFETDIKSKIFKVSPVDTYVAQLHIEYMPQVAGSFTIAYSKDGGITFHDYKTVTFLSGDVGKRLTSVCNKNIRSRSFMWRVHSSSGRFDIVEYSAYVFPTAGYTRAKTT